MCVTQNMRLTVNILYVTIKQAEVRVFKLLPRTQSLSTVHPLTHPLRSPHQAR